MAEDRALAAGPGVEVDVILEAAARWVAAELPLFALNCLLATTTGMWALRYPDVHDLPMLERGSGGPSGVCRSRCTGR